MVAIEILDEGLELTVPGGIDDLASFRHWVEAEDAPSKPRISYVARDIWVDLRKEHDSSSTLLTTQITTTLAGLHQSGPGSALLGGCVRLTNLEANFSVRPEAIFVRRASMDTRPVRFILREIGYPEVEGTPDMVLDVLSAGSVHRHAVLLRQSYWEAGIPEYWLVDARKEPIAFDILRHTSRDYVATRKQQGWLRSAVFGKSFRMVIPSIPPAPSDTLLEMR